MKAFVINDDDLYAANDAQEARALWLKTTNDDLEPEIRELSEVELDRRHPAFDKDERRIEGETTSVREMLAEHGNTPGWMAGMI